MRDIWTPHPGALDLLEKCGGPYDSPTYRRAVCATVAGHKDVSFGGILNDGTQAALALLVNRRLADSVPYGYGGIVATRRLHPQEQAAFLATARRSADAHVVTVRAVEGLGGQVFGRQIALTSLVSVDKPPDHAFTKKAKQSIRRAVRAGGRVAISGDSRHFLKLYEQASPNWAMQYPSALLTHLGQAGAARFYDVSIDGQVASSIVALLSDRHWMYWLAAQNAEGRAHELGYLAVSEMLRQAHVSGAGAVNLGASSNLPGVAAFKRRFGGVDQPVMLACSASTKGRARLAGLRMRHIVKLATGRAFR